MSVFVHPAEAAVKSAMAEHAAGRLASAESMYGAVLSQFPGDPLVTHLLGLVVGRLGRAIESVDLLEAAVATGNPPLAFYLAWLDAAIAAGAPDRAVVAARRTVAAFPTDPTANLRLSRLLAGDFVVPTNTAANEWHARADEHETRREWAEAVADRQVALAVWHHDPVGHKKLAGALLMLNRFDEAAQSHLTALQQCPDDAEAIMGIGMARFHQHKSTEAIALLHQATVADPNRSRAWSMLGMVASTAGDFETAMPAVRQAMLTAPNDPNVHSQLIVYLNYVNGSTPGVILEEAKSWAKKFAPDRLDDSFENRDRDPDRPIRIGFVSPDFRNHSVSFFVASVLGRMDRNRLWIACYSEAPDPDDVTVRIRAMANQWRPTFGLSDDAVAAQIRADRIDILIDLCGHLNGNRLRVFGHRPAPIQMTWLGYPGTTGMPAIDYRITDAHADPPGSADEFYSETLLRLPEAFFVYQPPEGAPPVAPLPMITNGRPTFGIFHLLQKATEQSCDLWAAAMTAVPAARLLWVGVAESIRPVMSKRLTDRGVAADRIEFAGRVSFANFLDLHARVDLALDACPWAGHTTTCHGLWMGVPTVSLAGPSAVSRAGMSVMSCLGLQRDWVTESPADFAGLVSDRVADPKSLADLRASLRGRMAKSAVTDTAGFTRNLGSALRQVFRRWCEFP